MIFGSVWRWYSEIGPFSLNSPFFQHVLNRPGVGMVSPEDI